MVSKSASISKHLPWALYKSAGSVRVSKVSLAALRRSSKNRMNDANSGVDSRKNVDAFVASEHSDTVYLGRYICANLILIQYI